MNTTEKTALLAQSITVYRGILKSKTSGALFDLLCAVNKKPKAFLKRWSTLANILYAENSFDNIAKSISAEALYDENAFTYEAAAKHEIPESTDKAVLRDISIIKLMCGISPKQILDDYKYKNHILQLEADLPMWGNGEVIEQLSGEQSIESLKSYYADNGCGIYARYKAFVWRDGKINPVVHSDPIELDELKGYEYQRKLVINNTKAFVDGLSANNCLLYGDKGTGKSSTVKAVVNKYYKYGLRIVEMPKERLCDFPILAEKIAALPMRFIIFIDDLSFQTQDTSYASLKAVLEGGLSSRPENTLIYATSNRRHLVKETFSDREGDEVHRNDSIQESLSLSDRFGLSINFSVPNKIGYLDIVLALAKQKGLKTDEEQLKLLAERWALERGGRSPRCAKQFIDSMFINKSKHINKREE